jgi:fatty acid synthase
LKLENKAEKSIKLLLIPGLEGMAGKAWHNIAKDLKYPTYILQTGKSWDVSTMDEIYNSVIDVRNFFKKN